MSTRNTVHGDRGNLRRKGVRRGSAGGSPGSRDLGNVKKRLFYKVFLRFRATFQIAFEKYTFLNRFEKYLGS